MAALKMPMAAMIIGPTCSGKTWLTTKLAGALFSGKNAVVPRNEGEAGMPKRIIYVGQFTPKGTPSADTGHNKSIEEMLKYSKEPALQYSFTEFSKANEDEQNLQDAFSGGTKMAGGASSAFRKILRELEEVAKEGDVIIWDDLQCFLRLMNPKEKTEFVNYIAANCHHKGISLIYLMQAVPRSGGDGFLENILLNSHYVFVITRNGLIEHEIDKLISNSHAAYKEARVHAKDLLNSCPDDKYPHYLLFDKNKFYHPISLHPTYHVFVPRPSTEYGGNPWEASVGPNPFRQPKQQNSPDSKRRRTAKPTKPTKPSSGV